MKIDGNMVIIKTESGGEAIFPVKYLVVDEQNETR